MNPDDFPILSAGPHPSLAADDLLFAPFIGRWDLDVTWYEGEQVVRQERGEWHLAWVLEGRAVQDIWIVPPRDERPSATDLYEYGTSLRFPDPSIGGWRSTWIGPTNRVVRSFVARGDRAGRVILESIPDGGQPLRWVFSDIAPESFTWTNSTETTAGEWAVTQTFVARRHHPHGSR